MKRFILLVALLSCNNFFSQTQNLYYKMETKVEGMPAMFAKMGKSSMTFYQRGDKIKTITTAMNSKQEVIIEEDQVTVYNKHEPKCAIFTKAEIMKDSLENDMVITDLKVEKTTESEKFLGYNCIKTIIRYKSGGYECQSDYWCTKEITPPLANGKPLEYMKRNALFVAMQELEGVVLKSETTMFSSGMKTISVVTEINKSEKEEPGYDLSKGPCKNPLNMAAYKAELARQKRNNQYGENLNHQMKMQGGW